MEKIQIILLENSKFILNSKNKYNFIKILDNKFEKLYKKLGFNEKLLFYVDNKENNDIINKSLFLKNIEIKIKINSVTNLFERIEEYLKEKYKDENITKNIENNKNNEDKKNNVNEINNKDKKNNKSKTNYGNEIINGNEVNDDVLDNIYIFLHNYEDIFLDIDLNQKILEETIKYDVEYFYGEGFSEGIIGQTFKASIVKEILNLVNETDQFNKNFIFNILLRNISFFDIDLIEGEEEPEIFRYSLKLNKKEDILLIENILDNLFDLKHFLNNKDKNKNKDKMDLNDEDYSLIDFKYIDIKNYLKNNPQILRTYPKTIFIEISSEYSSDLLYLPDKKYIKRDKKFISLNEIKKLFENNKYFFEDSVIILDGFGDPLINPEIFDIINFISETNEVIVRTTGSEINSDITKKLTNLENVKFIILLDAATENIYKLVGHKENFKKLETFVKYFLEKYNNNFYIEFVRMKENDMDIEQFYDKWKKYQQNIIFRKYNNYSGLIENREVADLTPVKRFPCFHLRRDFYILSDGKAAICKSDINGEIVNKNVFETNCYDIFKSYENLYINHIEKKYPEICKKCNEFYTFNF